MRSCGSLHYNFSVTHHELTYTHIIQHLQYGVGRVSAAEAEVDTFVEQMW